jgi:aspartate aminotransferase
VSIFKDAGMEVREYPYWHAASKGLDMDGFVTTMESAPEGSIFVLHVCAHNPTGVDPTAEQWLTLMKIMQRKQHFAFFDCAYQGFASGDPDADAYAVRLFVQHGFECFVAQSFAKNFGLYGQRVGCLTVVLKDPVMVVQQTLLF